MDPFEDIFPDVLENGAEEAGALIGESLELREPENRTGTGDELFLPPKKSFVRTTFEVKGSDAPPAYMIFGLELAIELAGRMIMLPPDEIAASAKQGKLEGELLDAFSEIANIFSGVVNSVFQESFAGKKLHFVKKDLEVYKGKTKDISLPEGSLSSFSGDLVLKDEKRGRIQFFFPHVLVEEKAEEAEKEEAEAAEEAGKTENTEKTDEAVKADKQADTEPPGEQAGAAQPEENQQPSSPQGSTETSAAEEGVTDTSAIDEVLLDFLDPARQELESLLGDSVEFSEPQTGFRSKKELFSKTRGKQVLTRIKADGENQGMVFMLLPLKDAVHFGGMLLMMPAESIAQVVKQAKFDGDVADSFGEIANILVGCCSNRFESEAPVRLKLKKEGVETLVPARAEENSGDLFASEDYYVLTSRIRVGENSYGPLEMVFPAELLGLAREVESRQSQKPAPGQKNDTAAAPSDAKEEKKNSRVVSVIGADQEHMKIVEEIIRAQGADFARCSQDDDLREAFAQKDPDCVFLFINRVNDQGLSRAIKVRSALHDSRPLIVAGPEWTRSMVIKARKYGATDILVTPADKDVIQRKCEKYL